MGPSRVTYDGLSPRDLAARIRAPSCLVVPRVTSTLDLVHQLAAEGAPDGTVVLADEQVAGRGREGRRWHSQRGAGILLGYLHRPAQEPIAGVLALRVGLAVGQALGALGLEPRLKWPNDVVMGDQKVGGILCEARTAPGGTTWVGLGIGLNVHGPLAPEVASRAATLDQRDPKVTRLAVLEELIPRLHQMRGGAALTAAEQAAYRRYDWLAGRDVVSPVAGRVVGVDVDGALLVESQGRPRRVLAGTVVVAM
ncbi:MAG: biotin--[acetyl-CoA-carboxylase] ligase [Gemmatimonadetes bacterium]|nr:biotin--[acetyl-CoA-carboxylase] ligase [Gemmatimonadota bacterium]MBI2537888.1 biotin--[acetyl-CoA-carboxylase] ligase [Gemmatimonadota bacterium]MBI2615007.1 biotin--[acetyl-CoA-carboxylase] ligase [Gemmatimonadota bacterium]